MDSGLIVAAVAMPVTSLGIVWFVVKEAREAWSGEDCCSHE